MNLTPSQRRAVESTRKNILCLANAGAGKSRVLVERVKHICGSGTDPAVVVVITFTVAAAAELRKRLSGYGDTLSYIGTIHSWMLHLLRKYCPKHASVAILSEDDRDQLIREIIAELRYNGSRTEVDEALSQGPFEVFTHTPTKADIVARAYFNRLTEMGSLDFDGLLWRGREWLVASGGECGGIEHLLLDECQDLTPLEWEINALAKVTNRFWVGDPDQSVYGWRGACPHIVTQMALTGKFEMPISR